MKNSSDFKNKNSKIIKSAVNVLSKEFQDIQLEKYKQNIFRRKYILYIK